MKVILLGASGIIGSEIERALSNNYLVVMVSLLQKGKL